MSNRMPNQVRRAEPILFCFCAPSAAGKTTITRRLIETDASLHLSISTTTREPRTGEVHGRDYFFVNEQQFQEKISTGALLEHAVFSGRRYGTGKENLEIAAARGADILFDIDVQGVEQVRRMRPDQLVVIFVFPPSMSILKERLAARGSEDPEKARRRLEAARGEIAKLSAPGFSDYLLVNDELSQAVDSARMIIEVERMRCRRLEFSALLREETTEKG